MLIEGKKIWKLASLCLVVAGVALMLPRGEESDAGQKMFFGMMKSMEAAGYFKAPDLIVENIELQDKKVVVKIKNIGGILKAADIGVKSNMLDREYLISDLNLDPEEIFTYDIPSDIASNYNKGKIQIDLITPDIDELSTENNSKELNFFNPEAKIKDLRLIELMEDGSYAIDFVLPENIQSSLNFEFKENEKADFPKENPKYGEVSSADFVREYYAFPNSLEVVENSSWKTKNITYFESKFYQGEKSFYLKAVNPINGFVLVSDIIMIEQSKIMNRAEMVKLFAESAGIEPEKRAESFFDDVDSTDWFAPYVEALHDRGLLSLETDSFFADKIATRGEVLKMVMEYDDANLVNRKKTAGFLDINSESLIAPYIQDFTASGLNSRLGQFFVPEAPASRNFLTFLMYEYDKNN